MEDETVLCLIQEPQLYPRYRRWVMNSYCQFKQWKPCINPFCSYVSFKPLSSSSSSTTESKITSRTATESVKPPALEESAAMIACRCGVLYCFKCREDAHWPVSCRARKHYLTSPHILENRRKHKLEFEVKSTGPAFEVATKPCPSCQTPWWKNGGCNHFTCSCGYEFCWLCLGEWRLHGGYACDASDAKDQYSITDLNGSQTVQVTTHSDASLQQLNTMVKKKNCV